MRNYYPRLADIQIRRMLSVMGAVVIEGPKWCGKTTTAEQFSKSQLYLASSEKKREYKLQGDINPEALLVGEYPRLIDEWQVAPKLWDAIRFDVDHSHEVGRFLLTGSSTPENKEEIFHSGTGRFGWVKMNPMSLYESGDSSGDISLKELFNAPEHVSGINKNNSLGRVAYLACRGGWPRAKEIADEDSALLIAKEYEKGIINTSLTDDEDKHSRKKTERLRRLLRSLARHQGTQASIETILEDIGNNFTSYKTLSSDLDYLAKNFVTENSLAWNPNLRSKTAIRTSDTHYFTDPSIAIAALGLGPGDLVNDLNTFGLIFETMAIRDLRIYADILDGNIYHYRDKSGCECDAVVHLRSGKYGLIEIKLGGDSLIQEAVDTLNDLKKNLDTEKMETPSFMAIVTATGSFAYRRPEDGIYIIPLECLKP